MEPAMTSFSAILVSYHTGPVMFASVTTLLKQPMLSELVLVDNGNPPDVLARIRQMALTESRIRVISGHGNVGYAKGCNIGAKAATGYFLILVNPDALLPPDTLPQISAAFERHSDAVMVGCAMLNPDGSLQPDSARPLLTPDTAIKSWFGGQPLLAGNESESKVVPAISGALMCLRRKDFDRLMGLDEVFVASGAGMDLCMRVQRLGGKAVYLPSVRVTRVDTRREPNKKTIAWQRARGQLHYFRKHFDSRYPLGFMLFVRIAVMSSLAMRLLSHWLTHMLRPSYSFTHTVPAKRMMALASGLADLPEESLLAGKTVLVTGATGQIGLAVIRRLLASQAAVLAISRNDPVPYTHKQLRWIKGDLTDSNLHLDGYLVDYVVHCAPLWHLPPTIKMLAESEVRKIVAFGSTSVFGKVVSRNYHERELVERLSRAEADVAEQCSLHRMEWTILRPTLTYGAGLDLNITSLAKLIGFLGFLPVYPPASGKRQPVHVDDLALAALNAIVRVETSMKSYNLSGGEPIGYRAMLERIFAAIGKKPRIKDTTFLPFLLDVAGKVSGKQHINGEIARRMNDDLMFFYDDARRDFGYSPRPFLSGGMKDIEGY
jgi:GT2 family glycosyltransferase/nucleoside-diphosphate-sugar epimerase